MATTIRFLFFSKKPESKHNFEGEAHAVDPGPREPAPPAAHCDVHATAGVRVCASRVGAPQVVPQTDEREDDPHAPDLGALATKRHVPEGSGELDAWGKGGKVKGVKVGVGSAVGIGFMHIYRMIHLFKVACQRRQKPAKE